MRILHSLVTTLVLIFNYAEFGSQMDNDQNQYDVFSNHEADLKHISHHNNALSSDYQESHPNQYHMINVSSNHQSYFFSVEQSSVVQPFHEQSSVGHSSTGQYSVGQSSIRESPFGHSSVGQSSVERLNVGKSPVGHSADVQHYNSHNDEQAHGISTSRAPRYNITALAELFDIYPTLVVHRHSLHHYHVEKSPSIVTPLREFDENGSNPGLRHAKLRLSSGYFRLNKEKTEYIPVRPFTNMRLLLSVPDMCILGLLDGSDIFWGLYAIYNGTIQRVLVPRSRKYAELMLLDEISEYPDQRIFLKQLLPRKRKQPFPLPDKNI